MDYNKPSGAHNHRWMFLIVKGNYESDGQDRYKFTEYAYLVCNGPTHQPIVIKQPVEKLDEVDIG